VQNLNKNGGLSDYKGDQNSEEHYALRNALRRNPENTERINDLSNNKDCNVSSKVDQNNAIETTNDLSGTPTSKIGICKHCGKPFEKRTTWHIFCEEQCRLDYHGVQDIGELKIKKRKR
jgi:hypothetical protein